MNLEKLFEMQKVLDDHIIKEKGLEGKDLYPNTVLSLIVELGEFANEGRWFKHWSDDQEPRTKKWIGMEYKDNEFGGIDPVHRTDKYSNPLLEEYVDCLHFFLSIAIQKGWQEALYIPLEPIQETIEDGFEGGLTGIFLEMIYFLNNSYMEDHPEDKMIADFQVNAYWFRTAWSLFITIGIGGFRFTEEEIEQAYFTKNAVNHKRQEQGY